tara:strand:+ start:265 stop:939 length:675 start_codon:yes stop_codon:yes gene_type:complete
MAVIGSRDNFNRDPAKMPRFNADFQSVGVWANNNFRAYGAYYYNTNTLTAFTDTDSVTNTHRTIYSVSGKGGSLIYAFGGAAPNGTANLITTFVITVDGVATTVTLAPAAGNYYIRGYLGLPAGITLQQALNNNPASTALIAPQSSMDAGTSSAPVGNPDNKTVDYTGSSGYYSKQLWPNVNAPLVNPEACVRFENSLTITVASSAGTTHADSRQAGCLVRLDT